MTTTKEIFCLKCQKPTQTNDLQEVVMKNGRDAVTGVCADCGKKKFRTGKMA